MTDHGESSAGASFQNGALLIHGDARAMPLASDSIDAVVCDPPYGLEFMGQEWDKFARPDRSQAKAGMARTGSIVQGDGVLPSFLGGLNPRCRSCGHSQRGASPCACDRPDLPNERAERMEGFQTWCEAWATEALRVAKPGAHLVAFGGTRTHHRLHSGVEDAGWEIRDMGVWLYRNGFPKHRGVMKPAIETWLVARKPCSERNVSLNVERWGTGWLNIEGCRIGDEGGCRRDADDIVHGDANAVLGTGLDLANASPRVEGLGRHPANVATLEPDWDLRMFRLAAGLLDYAKASSDEKPWDAKANRGPRQSDTGSPVDAGEFGGNPQAQHPTVKPLALMRHIVRLACPPGGTVLDPFLGSGTTVEAAVLEGLAAVGVELNGDYLTLAQRRLAKPLQVSLFGAVA